MCVCVCVETNKGWGKNHLSRLESTTSSTGLSYKEIKAGRGEVTLQGQRIWSGRAGIHPYHIKVHSVPTSLSIKIEKLRDPWLLNTLPSLNPSTVFSFPQSALDILFLHSSNLHFSWRTNFFPDSPVVPHTPHFSLQMLKNGYQMPTPTLGEYIKICPINIFPLFKKHVHHIAYVMFTAIYLVRSQVSVKTNRAK